MQSSIKKDQTYLFGLFFSLHQFPIAIRFWLASRPKLLTQIYNIVIKEIGKFYKLNAQDVDGPRAGGVTFIQRFGGALNLNVHFHILFVEGVFEKKTTGRYKFYHTRGPSDDDVRKLVKIIGDKVQRLLRKQGFLDDDDFLSKDTPENTLLDDNPHYANSMAASVQYRVGGRSRR